MKTVVRQLSKWIILKTIAIALAVVTALYCACPAAYAEGGGPGNGGDAVLIDGKWILLDFAEAGIEKSKVFDEALSYYREHRDFLQKKSLLQKLVDERFSDPRFSSEFRNALVANLNTSWQDRGSLLAAMLLYQWQFSDLKPTDVEDEDSTIELKYQKKEQVAVRRDDRIRIYTPIFLKMDLLNQVALVYHELAYSLLIPQKGKDGFLFQPSRIARNWVADHFSREWTDYMASMGYGQSDFTFEATNSVYFPWNIGTRQDGPVATYLVSQPDFHICEDNTFNGFPEPKTQGAGRSNPYEFLLFGLTLQTESRRCFHVKSAQYFHTAPEQFPLSLRPEEWHVDSFCQPVPGQPSVTTRFTVYAVSPRTRWILDKFETRTGLALRPTLKEDTLVDSRSYSYGSTESCKKEIDRALQEQYEVSLGTFGKRMAY